MVAAISSYDELFESAYDNICLIGDNTWEYSKEDSYRELNRILWVKISKLRQEENHEKLKRYVADVIPNSRLSKYGNYRYDDDRESLYVEHFDDKIDELRLLFDESEPWLYQDVEEHFTRLMKPVKLTENRDNEESGKSDSVKIDEFKKYSSIYKITSNSELQLAQRISSNAVRDIWRNNAAISQFMSLKKKHKNDHKPREMRYKNETPSNLQQTIIVPKNRYKDRECRCSKTLPILSAEVPEFFPKAPRMTGQFESVPLQYYPSVQERVYNRAPMPNVSAIFQNPGIPLLAAPVITPLMRAPHWLQRLPPPLRIQVPVCTIAPQSFTSIQSICPIIHRPIQLNETIIQPNQMNSTSIPVYQRPYEHYHDNRKKNNGVDFKNLILLTKNGMKTRKNQSNLSHECHLSLDNSQINLKTKNVLQWIDRVHGKEEIISTNSILSDSTNFNGKFNTKASVSNLAELDNEDELLMNPK